jgi:hypothetical protein
VHSSLFAKILAWGSPQMARRILRKTNPSSASESRLYCFLIQSGNNANSIFIYSYWLSCALKYFFQIQAHVLCAFCAEEAVPH